MRLSEFRPKYPDRLSPLALRVLTEEQDGLLLVGETLSSMPFSVTSYMCYQNNRQNAQDGIEHGGNTLFSDEIKLSRI